MSADTNASHSLVAEVTNLEGSEEEILAEESLIRDCLLGQTFKPTTAKELSRVLVTIDGVRIGE
jgi:hypothetical protein